MAEVPWNVLGFGTLGWSAAFVGVRMLLPRRSHDFCNRIISLVHVAFAIVLSSLSFQDWRHPFTPLASPPSPKQVLTMSVSLSYFVYDLFCCLLDVRVDLATLVHHLLGISTLAYGIFGNMTALLGFIKVYIYAVLTDKVKSSSNLRRVDIVLILSLSSGTEIIGCLWLSELSNPFMHARELMKELGMRDTPLNLANDTCFAVVFIICRMFFGSFLTYATVHANNPLPVKIGATGMLGISAFWAYKIVRMAYRKLTMPKKAV